MNRREVLVGAGAIAAGSVVPWNGVQAHVPVGVDLSTLAPGIRGSFMVRGTAVVIGTIPQPGSSPARAGMPAAAPVAIVQDNAAPATSAAPPAASFATPAYSAPAAAAPRMTIVAVPRGTARREARTLD